MKTSEPRAVHLKDYTPPPYRIGTIALDFTLEPNATRVTSTMAVKRAGKDSAPLVLDGKNLKLISVAIDGKALDATAYAQDEATLTLPNPPAEFTLTIVTEIAPAANTALEGLYMASGIYCTQCEPEGFRAITYFLDRPDNLSVYETRIEADKQTAPVLLSNGNLVESGDLPNGKHFARWQDPFPKPSYLFALVAGDLGHISDSHTTSSGRKVDLKIYVEHGNEDKALYAMDSLKRSMEWDEKAYGREYDLDIFMIVAVSAFNFGAMENKGLNIFNDKVLLASPETATDDDYARIEAVVGHEYFHNWTGDRITCRDWFQLSLKEGLTVYRESGFAGDQRSHAVRRISDVKDLRLRQFQEDSGPLAHPVQPQSYIAIDNFYTATIYEKGAEVISMLRTIVGDENFRKGMDLYFERHDGDAATVEDFVRVFEDVSKTSLKQFRLWYAQAGTPEVRVKATYDAGAKTYRLDLAQSLAPTPGQPEKLPMPIPLRMGLIGKSSGAPLPLTLEGENAVGANERVLTLDTPSQSFTFTNVTEEPALSLGRDFSAPIRIVQDMDRATRAFLLARDTDGFNRWESAQQLGADVIRGMMAGEKPDPIYIEAMGAALARADEDHAFCAQVLIPPSEQEIALSVKEADPGAIHTARDTLIRAVAKAHRAAFESLYKRLTVKTPFSASAEAAARRALANSSLRFLTAENDEAAAALADAHYRGATNMTDRVAGLAALSRMESPKRQAAFDDFYLHFENQPLVLDKWMGLQAMSPRARTIDTVREMMKHKAFSMKNPNRVRALIGAFASGNPLRFHDASGEGYRLFREVIGELDSINPSTAARMATVLEGWRRYNPARQQLMRDELEILAKTKGISPNLYEIVTKMLG